MSPRPKVNVAKKLQAGFNFITEAKMLHLPMSSSYHFVVWHHACLLKEPANFKMDAGRRMTPWLENMPDRQTLKVNRKVKGVTEGNTRYKVN